jgi:hypothetical protein
MVIFNISLLWFVSRNEVKHLNCGIISENAVLDLYHKYDLFSQKWILSFYLFYDTFPPDLFAVNFNLYKSVNHVNFSWNFVLRTQLTLTIFVYRIFTSNYFNF